MSSLTRPNLPQSIAWIALAVAVGILLVEPLPPLESRALALVIGGIGLWATSAIPEPMTAVFFFTCAMLLKVAPAGVVFGGFESTAMWLIFGGLVMGVAVKSTGLGERIATSLGRSFGRSYWGVITGVTVVGVAMGFLMPSSMGRAILLMPIALSIAARYGFKPGSNGHIAVVLAAAMGCHVPTFSILPANVPNLVLVGAAETLWHYSPSYGEYLLLHFPVLGFLKTAIMIPLIVKLWPDTPRPSGAAETEHGPLTVGEIKLSAVLAGALVLWATDFAHHVSPAWISMAGASVLLLPGVGLIDRKAFAEKINFNSMLHVAGIMALGALVDKSGLGLRMAEALLAVMPLEPGHPVANFASLAGISTLISMFTTLPGAPAVLTPLAGEMAKAAGLPVEAVLMSQVLGFSNPILPYESAPLVVAMQLGGERMGTAQTLCLWLAAATILILLPLNYLWWHWLGWI
jgi:di/tricarboxylate transporter